MIGLWFLYSLAAGASEIVLERSNHLGIHKMDLLRTENGKYYFNGKDLGASLPAPVLKAWQEVEKGPLPVKGLSCPAGIYRFTLKEKENTKSQERRGCTSGAAYAKLIRSLEIIRSHARGAQR